ncbi:enhanced serine sensitivity protein SseB [Lentilactobacillus parafarraginis]|uniref:SseB protein C-terminal domain-containing protein n=3 Tax=Lentilactobacillus parafarraginis TaxID=390842 RepID=A0A0R1YNR1_9LACO|nr:enhanced serine sensitivity protein SseB C-terminal domain-containing protein [Lentilactobacillus parafarraginis]KRM44088.1 hypothetical protein FD47_GL000961 [Lentilactobacillus parafarraginis DSM 18390 = JCM 14109]TLQ18086.1 enhanced serine sensitivity protein SseB [Lentilactobacillus parafarraginis]
MEDAKLISKPDISEPPKRTGPKPDGITPFKTAGFGLRLQAFMNQPMDPEIEHRFAASLLKMTFYVPVQTGHRYATARQPDPAMTLSVAVTTYLADGEKYIPAFTDLAKLQKFLAGAPNMTPFRSFEFTSEELMGQSKKFQINGVLINPGNESFPLTQEYWQYIHQVAPVVVTRAQNPKSTYQLINPTPRKLEGELRRTLRKLRHVKQAWLVGMRTTEDDDYQYTIIVDYVGRPDKFEEKVSRKLALAAHRHLPYGSDIIVGQLRDPVGQEIKARVAPFYTRKSGWFD